MAEDYLEELQHTFRFLSNFSCQSSGFVQDKFLIRDGFLENLRLDGYRLQPIEAITHRYLRDEGLEETDLSVNLIMILLCVTCAGFASGLTQGLLSLDYLEMTVKSQSGTPKEKEYASRVLPVIKHHHLLLVTLMLWNATATEALPLFLNALVPEYVAIIISVTLVLMFGEIIPASILTGPRQLEIVSFLTPLVYLVYGIFFPVAYPISKVLDYIIGHEDGLTLYSRREIITMMRMQHEEASRRHHGGAAMRDSVVKEEMMIIDGALTFRDRKVSEVMTPIDKTFMISANENLSYKTLYEIFKAGFSRIPVYEKDRNEIIGLLFAKDLIFVDPEDETPISNFVEFFGRRPMTVWHDQLLGEVLTTFRRERAHLAIVRDVIVAGDSDPSYKVVGIITLEDILEEIIGAEIEDEFDLIHDDPEASTTTPGGSGGGFDRHLRDLDVARLKSLRSKATDETLSPDEFQAIVNFLPKHAPQFQTYLEKYKLSLPEVIQQSQVFHLTKQTPEGALHPHSSDMIVKKGKCTNTCILILQGRIKIVEETSNAAEAVSHSHSSTNSSTPVTTPPPPLPPSRSSSISEDSSNILSITVKTMATETILGPWSILCADSLVSADGTYTPNFSAYIHSKDVRFVRIATIFRPELSNYNRRGRGLPAKGESRSQDQYHLATGRSKASHTRDSKVSTTFARTRSYHGTTNEVDDPPPKPNQNHSTSNRDTNFFFRRSFTTQPGDFRGARTLSGVDEVSPTRNSSSSDKPMILLTSLFRREQPRRPEDGLHDHSDDSNHKSEDNLGSKSYLSFQPFSIATTSTLSSSQQDYSNSKQPISFNTDSPQQSRDRKNSPHTSSFRQKRLQQNSPNNSTNPLRTPLMDPQERKDSVEGVVINQLHEERK